MKFEYQASFYAGDQSEETEWLSLLELERLMTEIQEKMPKKGLPWQIVARIIEEDSKT